MRRRGLTVLLGALLTTLLSIGVLAAPIPSWCSARTDGQHAGHPDGREVIQVSGRETSTSAGQLRLTTVGVQPQVKLRSAIRRGSHRRGVVPRELVYPPGESREQVEERNARTSRSPTSAETAA